VTTEWNWAVIRARCRIEALRILRSPADADEVVQEALLRAWTHRSTCRTPEAPIGWCLQITRNEALRVLSRHRNQATAGPLPEGGADEPVDERSGRESDRTLTRLAVTDLLAGLSAHERKLIALRYEHGFTHPEIARALQMSEATARVHLHRAHKRLRTKLGDFTEY
jgi:RNA polymerase sigma-70 factor (ECF subfamily)